MARNRLLGAAALSAALLGGGVAGAVLATPALTSAQEEGTPTTAAPPTDDGATDGAAKADGFGEEGCHDGRPHWLRPGLDAAAEALGMTEDELLGALRDGKSIADVAGERGVDVQSVVDALVAQATAKIDDEVADGDLDEERAAELKAELPERIADLVERDGPMRDGGGRGGPHWLRPGLDAAAEALGMTEDELLGALREGKSIADVAGERGVDVQSVVDALVAQATAKIDDEVADGDLDEERAAELKAELPERIADLIDRDGPVRDGPVRGGPGGGRGFGRHR